MQNEIQYQNGEIIKQKKTRDGWKSSKSKVKMKENQRTS